MKVPVSNLNANVNVEVSVSNGTAAIESLSKEQVAQMTGSEKDGGDVVIDLSRLGKNVSGVEIPTETLKDIEASSENEESGLEIKLPTGTLFFDGPALDAIIEQGGREDVRIHLEDVGTARMNSAQKKALQGKNVRKGFDVYITANGKRVSDFKGGRAGVKVDVPMSKGDRPEGFSVWFVDEDGSMEKLNSWYDGKTKSFSVGHFSDYVILYEDRIRDTFRACSRGNACPLHAYADLSTNAWYHDGVHYCLENGLMLGSDAHHFHPGENVTRAMAVTVLWNLNGSPIMKDTGMFTDVMEGQWYTEAVRWAKAVGITKGYSDGRFGTHDAVTREQLAVFLHQYIHSKGYDTSGLDKNRILAYSDIFDVNEYAVYALQWACGNGVITGQEVNGELFLMPGSTATRSQLATMMMRLRTEMSD